MSLINRKAEFSIELGGYPPMTNTESQGAGEKTMWKTAAVPADFGLAEQWKMQGHYVARYEADERVAALERELSSLRETVGKLKLYAGHLDDCHYREWNECTCGFTEAFRAALTSPEEVNQHEPSA